MLLLTRSVPRGSDGTARVLGRHIYILPTGTGLVFAAVLLLMLLGSLNYQNNLGLLLTFLMGSIALVAMHHTWFNLLHLVVSARGGPPVFAGQPALFTLTLSDGGRRARADLRALSHRGAGAAVTLGPGGNAPLELRLASGRRGWCRLREVRLETRYPIGLFRAWCRVEVEARVMVYPSPAPRGPTPAAMPALSQSSLGDLGTGADDFVGLRGYRPGDSPRHLDWKALARERGLVVKHFGGDRAAQVWLDWAQLPPAGVEPRLSLLCRQVLEAAEAGISYGLRLPGLTLSPGQGETHRHRCLEALATFGQA
jgi:uncharacterized protein (DUF58 family)